MQWHRKKNDIINCIPNKKYKIKQHENGSTLTHSLACLKIHK